MEPKFGDIVEWVGGQKCMVIVGDPPVFLQLTQDGFGDPPPYDVTKSNYPFDDRDSWKLIDVYAA